MQPPSTAETVAHLERLRRLGQSMDPSIPAVDVALVEVRRRLDAAGVPYRIVGGIAVVHHGYARFTDDIDILVDGSAVERLESSLAVEGFSRAGRTRWRHDRTGVSIDILVGGEAMPRPPGACYPFVDEVEPSARDAGVVGLVGLVRLKLAAGRHQDAADVVALMKLLDDAAYIALEGAMADGQLRRALAELRRDALEEMGWEGGESGG